MKGVIVTTTTIRQQNYYTPVLDDSHIKTIRERIGEWWLKQDYLLLPIQPNSKKLVPGFGEYRDKIRTPERIAQWFGERSLANIAVCGTQTSFILDFDDPDLYKFWALKFPIESKTYTEITQNGGYHVFAHAWKESIRRVNLIKGVEIKRVVLVYPSVIDNRFYVRGNGELLTVDAELLLSPLSEAPITRSSPRFDVRDSSYLQKIKSAFLCLDLVQTANPKIKVYGSSNRFVSLPCPFHNDQEPSFWIDTERNLWGCHACGIRGDAINLYARLKGITNREAIREMGKSL